ncbi:hypothetical protein OG884_04415 [Streptosporangium sp. NBC_01755]|uniref:hypothetical protein n=1 Tax=unclassified Streptosporangium TaxID=2632669 RepID=UPI002DD997F2|nr:MULTISPECIES: hypothetical protein [unclassified Streptosporangium]WSA27261.1 hypothetical protein OIE13_05115 [Streptosporangium sp. NBC_01810]WSD01186.1 hypothetical protein OG884_04415 [Streptosporangium sp. NBC_01755]
MGDIHTTKKMILLCSAIMFVSACAGQAGVGGDSRAAVDQWREFPYARDPRPIVIIEDLPKSLGNAKPGTQFTLRKKLSDDPPESQEILLHGGRVSLTQISAADAFDYLSVQLRQLPGETNLMTVVKARLNQLEWMTDRGSLSLPSWSFYTDDGGSVSWPAVTPDAFWRLGKIRRSATINSVSLDASKTSLSFEMIADPNPCDGSTGGDHFEAGQLQSTVVIFTGESSAADSGCDRPAFAMLRSGTVRIDRPLEGRVVVDQHGNPVPVEMP